MLGKFFLTFLCPFLCSSFKKVEKVHGKMSGPVCHAEVCHLQFFPFTLQINARVHQHTDLLRALICALFHSVCFSRSLQ